MPTYSSALLPTTNGLTFGSGALRWTAYIQDIDIAGTFTAASRLGVKNLEDIRFADQFSGTVTQQIDAALADISSVGLVVVPSSMGAGNATSIASGKAILDLRSGVPKFFTNNSVSSAAWQLNNDGTVTSQGVKSVTTNPAATGFIRAAKSDAINFRNNANGADVNGLSLDGSDIVQVGGAAGAKTIGAMAISGALTGVTNLSYSGQIISSVATGTAPFSVTSTTVVPTLNVATLNGVTVSGTPAASSYALMSTGTSTAGWSLLSNQYKLESINTTPASNSAGTTANITTFSLPANELATGQCLRIYAHGTYTNNTGGNATNGLVIKLGSTTIASGSLNITNTSTTTFRLEALVMCVSNGASGTFEYHGLGGPSSGTTPTVSSATVSIDTTVSNTVAAAPFGAVGSTTITCRSLVIERIG